MIINKRFFAKFIGKQIARLKIARDVLTIFSTIISMISLVTIALSATGFDINLESYVLLLIVSIIFTWFVGYLMDKTKIRDQDNMLTVEKSFDSTGVLWKKVVIPQLKEMLVEILNENG